MPFFLTLYVLGAAVLSSKSISVSALQDTCTPNYGSYSVFDTVTAPDFSTIQLYLQDHTEPIELALNRSWSPEGVDHFYALARDGYYNCAAFYSVNTTKNAPYAQAGIAADPTVTDKWNFFIDDDEVTVTRQSNLKYTLSYVPHDGFGTRSTYFMINFADNTYLDSIGYYPFAEVVGGFDTLTALAAQPFPATGQDISDDGMAEFIDQGNTWLLETYGADGESIVPLISTIQLPDVSSSSSDKDATAGSWAFASITIILSTGASLYGIFWIYRYLRKIKDEEYGVMLNESETGGSSDKIIHLNSAEI